MAHIPKNLATARMNSHVKHLRDLGRRILVQAHEMSGPLPMDEFSRRRREREVVAFVGRLEQEMESRRHLAFENQTINGEAFARLVHELSREFTRAVAREAGRLLQIESGDGGGGEK